MFFIELFNDILYLSFCIIFVEGRSTMEMNVKVDELYGDTYFKLDFPETWKIREIVMAGHDRPAMTGEEMRDAFAHPIGSPTIREMARGKRGKVVVTCDDIQRPTPAHDVFPTIMEELHEAGISDDQILVLCATGCHFPISSDQFARKIGWSMVQKYVCVNHNIYEHLFHLGHTSRNTPLLTNHEFVKADLRISVCGIKKHGVAGAGGSGKAVIPGVASLKTTQWNHRNIKALSKVGEWRIKDNDVRLDMQEAGRIANLDVVINCVYNNNRDIIGLYVGDLDDSWHEAVKFAYKMHSTPTPNEKSDVVITNSYPQANKGVAWSGAIDSLREGGTAVGIHKFPLGNFGRYAFLEDRDWWNRQQGYPDRPWPVKQASNILICDPKPTKWDVLQINDKVQFTTTWEQTLKKLISVHGEDASVIIYPYAQLQFNPKKHRLMI